MKNKSAALVVSDDERARREFSVQMDLNKKIETLVQTVGILKAEMMTKSMQTKSYMQEPEINDFSTMMRRSG